MFKRCTISAVPLLLQSRKKMCSLRGTDGYCTAKIEEIDVLYHNAYTFCESL